MIVRLLCLFMLAASLYGYLQFFSRKTKTEFAFGITFSVIGCAMFFAGILNVLPYAAYTVCGLGVVLAGYSLIKRESIFALITPGTVFFALMSVALLFILHGSLFKHIDNFSHWATAAKTLLQNDAFPRPYDINIFFQSYPLGSAAFIYYIAKIYGAYPEWIMMFAQAIFMLGCLVGIFAFAKDVKGNIFAAVTVIMLLCSNNNLVDLLVDTLLPVVAVGAAAICIYYKDDILKAVIYTLPFTSMLTSIKNSGLFFVAVIVLYIAAVTIRKRERILGAAVSVLSPAITFAAWKVHTKIVFTNADKTKHSLSVENMGNVLSEKTPEDIKNIFLNFCKEMFSVENTFVLVILFFVIVTLWLAKNSGSEKWKGIMIFTILSYIGYQLGNLAMYMLTMPKSEALDLASYSRYHQTILIFVIGIVCIGVMECVLPAIGRKSATGSLVCVVLSILIFVFALKPDFTFYKPQTEEQVVTRIRMNTLVEQYQIPAGKSYIFIVSDKRDYVSFLAHHTLKAARVKLCYSDDLRANSAELENYEYIIAFDTEEDISDYMQEAYGSAEQLVVYIA